MDRMDGKGDGTGSICVVRTVICNKMYGPLYKFTLVSPPKKKKKNSCGPKKVSEVNKNINR